MGADARRHSARVEHPCTDARSFHAAAAACPSARGPHVTVEAFRLAVRVQSRSDDLARRTTRRYTTRRRSVRAPRGHRWTRSCRIAPRSIDGSRRAARLNIASSTLPLAARRSPRREAVWRLRSPVVSKGTVLTGDRARAEAASLDRNPKRAHRDRQLSPTRMRRRRRRAA